MSLRNRTFDYESLVEFRALKGVDILDFEVQKQSMVQKASVLITGHVVGYSNTGVK